MRTAIPSAPAAALAAVCVFASAPAMSDRLGLDNSREILSELRKINENLDKINKYLEKFDRELASDQRGTESERIFRELNEILRDQKTRSPIPGPSDSPANFR